MRNNEEARRNRRRKKLENLSMGIIYADESGLVEVALDRIRSN